MVTPTKGSKPTPLMQQYFEVKAQFPEALVMFQVGDFFELFFDDAITAAGFLNITLTKRGTNLGEPIPLCGVPAHTLEVYLAKLVKGGFKVAICEQLEAAQLGKMVARGVTRVLTPGTLVESNLLADKSASYFCSFYPMQTSWGVLFGELLTSQLFATVLPAQSFRTLESELARFFPDEILVPETAQGKQLQAFFKTLGYVTSLQPEGVALSDLELQQWLVGQFPTLTTEQLIQSPALQKALGNFYSYLEQCQKRALTQFNQIHFYQPADYLILDAPTQRHLELVSNSYDGTRKHTLLEHLDQSVTAMGSRMLRKWLVRPLVVQAEIERRQAVVHALATQIVLRDKISQSLKQIADLERVVGRIGLGRGQLADYLQLQAALTELPNLKLRLQELGQLELINLINQRLLDFAKLRELLQSALNSDQTRDWVIAVGYDLELDRVRELVQHASHKIIELEQREQQATGINSLKIRYNQVHGYYIEITKANLSQVPAHYLRQQTLVGKERFMTLELQQLQVEIESARQDIGSLESQIFAKVQIEVGHYVHDLRKLAQALAHLDALLGLANLAYAQGYVRPTFNDHREIKVQAGRHPVVEQLLEETFIANDTSLTDQESLWVITGPNMGGKSTYLRQVAVICIMAQIGSFVPAQSACLPILDRIFTRIGASDQLAFGKSTFLVEMEETAAICQQATKDSLVILDEVGRGTSTFDGLAIAQAVVEYLYQQVGARCLFATHYHELTDLTNKFSGIVPYYAASQRTNSGVVLLHKIVPGVADGSFGVEVAKMAELPNWIVRRAEQLLQELHQNNSLYRPSFVDSNQAQIRQLQNMLSEKSALLDQIKQLNLDELSPKAAFDQLYKFQKEIL